MTLTCTINGFTVTGTDNEKWEATCEHDEQVLCFTDLTSAYYYLHNHEMCWEYNEHLSPEGIDFSPARLRVARPRILHNTYDR